MSRTCMLTIASFVFALSLVVPAQSDTTEEFHKTFALAPAAPIRVSNTGGKVEVSSWDQPYADVRAVKHSHHGRAELDRVSIEINSANTSLDIQTVYDCSKVHSREGEGFLHRLFGDMDSGSRAWVDYTIRIPRTAILEQVKTSSGDIDIRDVHGDASLHASSGNITVSGADGALDIRSSSGDITATRCLLRYVHSSSGDIHLMDVRGNFQVESSSGDGEITGADGQIDAHSSSGDYTIRDARGMTSVETSSGLVRAENCILSNVKTTSGDIRLRGVRGDMKLRTSSGTVQVEGTDGTVDAHSTSGNIWIEGLVLRSATSSSGDIRIRAAGLAGSVLLSATSGDITVDIPDGVNADLVLETSSGNLNNRSGQPISATAITRKKIAGRLGSGGAPFVVRTSSGNVELK